MLVSITNRTGAKGKEAAEMLNIDFLPWDSSWEGYNLLISALPGLADPLAGHPEFRGIIIDAAYPRSKTTLRGQKRGLKAVRGEEWLIEQGKASYTIMTRLEPFRAGIENLTSNSCRKRKPLILTGFMGSGKTAVAKRLEEEGLKVFSTDGEIEKRVGMSVNEAFSNLGEAKFRSLEREIVGRGDLCSCDVIDSGGGIWLDPENRKYLPEEAFFLFLWTTPETAFKRASDRPLLKKRSIREARKLYEKRLAQYISLSDLIIPTEFLSSREAAERLKREMENVSG